MKPRDRVQVVAAADDHLHRCGRRNHPDLHIIKFTARIFVLIVAMIVSDWWLTSSAAASASSIGFEPPDYTGSCHRKREILTDSWGVISDGDGNYLESSHCEWLIQANFSGFIHLKFLKLDTECAFDFIFVYDGDSYGNSTHMGSFSGTTIPPTLMAKSGKMLIMLFSDDNYALKGFEAEYSVTECPFNCSDHGVCDNGSCICDHPWDGQWCQLPLCPNECGSTKVHGTCQPFPEPARCRCFTGFIGYSCSVGLNTTQNTNWWHVLTPEVLNYNYNNVNNNIGEAEEDGAINKEELFLVPRMGHAGTYLPYWDRFYVHGGFDLNHVLDHFQVFSTESNKWEGVNLSGENPVSPSARYGHAAVAYGDGFAMFGGILANGSFSNELWHFNATTNVWSLQTTKSIIKPPALARHSLTVVDEYQIYLFGGNYENGSFSSQMFRVNIKEGELAQWERVRALGGLETKRRLAGHSAVFHSLSRSLIIYGGLRVEMARVNHLSDQMHVFNVDTRYWSQVHYPRPNNSSHVPIERAFHTASVIGHYMLVFGGYIHDHAKEEKCYDNKVYFYHLGCHVWVNVDNFREDFQGNSFPVSQGLHSHVAGVRDGNTLLIAGGFSGTARGYFLAYLAPFVVSPPATYPRSSQSLCSSHKSRDGCRANPDCGWCQISPGNATCLDRWDVKSCVHFLESSSCPGICPHLRDCQSCLAHGSGFRSYFGMIPGMTSLRPCAWRVQHRICHTRDLSAFARSSTNSSAFLAGWWGHNFTEIVSLEECLVKDFPPGITLLKYYYPANRSQPDEVSVVNTTSQSLSLYPQYITRRNASLHLIYRFFGFLHPICLRSKTASTIRLFLKMMKVNGVLKISTNEKQENLEVVANVSTGINSSLTPRYEAHRSGNRALFPNTTLGHKYLMDFELKDIVLGNTSAVDIFWNGCPDTDKHFTSEFLEPYNRGFCNSYSNCIQCLSDTLCGWCETSSSCFPRLHNNNQTKTSASSSRSCMDGIHTRFLITQPDDCVTCSSYVHCHDCAKNNLCEWLIDESYCVRRGSFDDAVRNFSHCPVPCHKLADCRSCLTNDDRCAWCEAAQQCFSFYTYSSSYQFGTCGRWVESDHLLHSADSNCLVCDHHNTCKNCLSEFGCGWCYNNHNPLMGVCTKGDFRGPTNGHICSSLVASVHNLSVTEVTDWTYGICPDVEECSMGLHRCHANATCTNTFDSYICTCNRGFRADENETCSQTCFESCVHGHCSETPLYKCVCELGWTGLDCSINCGCNNHSTCTTGVEVCDKCHNWTVGDHCEKCKPGSYGNATSDRGCKKCECNGHGDIDKGYCDVNTGICFCKDNAEGDHCDKCADGYYGDPKNGSHCYRRCEARVLLTEALTGGLGAPVGGPNGETCLWIISVEPELTLPTKHLSASITLTIEADLKVKCGSNYIYAYNGLPHFISPNENVKTDTGLVAAFCNTRLKGSLTVKVSSGIMTVFYQRDDPTQGFNATYVVKSCSERCGENKTCVDGECRCSFGSCGIPLCPNNCTVGNHIRGRCIEDYGRCDCFPGYGGSDCSLNIASSDIVFSTLFNPERVSPSVHRQFSLLPRMGHTMVADHQGSLWIYGGWSISKGILSDILQFDAITDTWHEVNVQVQPLLGGSSSVPTGRYFHASAYVTAQRVFYTYGGLSDSEEHHVLDDFWKYNIFFRTWTQVLPQGLTPSPLAGHTLTNRDDESLVLIGGFDTLLGFSDKTYEFNLKTGLWRLLNVTGPYPLGIYGHTTVYYEPSQSFYVYGGVLFKVNKTIVSHDLYAFHYPSGRWTVLPLDEDVNPKTLSRHLPSPRYLHSAVTMAEFMLVMGGQTENGDLVTSVHAYVYDCNMWVDIQANGTTVVGDKYYPTLGQAAVVTATGVYVFGGFIGTSVATLMRLEMPTDICKLYKSRSTCHLKHGCSFCSVYQSDGVNMSFCYSNKYEIPNSCQKPVGTSELSNGIACKKEWIERRNCYQYNSCTDCLATWPTHSDAKNVCQWCSWCNRCIRIGANCDEEKNCSNKHFSTMRYVEQCRERLCGASDCEKCRDMGNCIWTRQVIRSSDFWRMATNKPNHNWNCFHKGVPNAFNFTVVTMPPKACPPRCVQLKDCKTCLNSDGAEGGWRECRWSETLKECISPSYQLLRCAGGVCGGIMSHCPRPCSEFTQCSHCLSQSHCGWCAFNQHSRSGGGMCMEGGLHGPLSGTCISSGVVISVGLNSTVTETSSRMWSYLKCPPENECINNHHTCDWKSEECIDNEEGFECKCRKGYLLENKLCKPVCNKGCVNGTCTEPDVCVCHFGYVGEDCSIGCQCNGHSNCAGPNQLTTCLKCHNHTQGKQCEKCEPLYVGDPQNNGQCISCSTYCNNHSDICISPDFRSHYFNMSSNINKHDLLVELKQFVTEGPTMEAVCLKCQDFTEGDRCNSCILGYFRTSDSPQDKCQLCQCNGHGDTCNRVNGEQCNCDNNTSSDLQQCSQKGKGNNTPCWKVQCSKCNEYFMGTPTNGHQCYRQMFVDKEYCLNPKNIEQCGYTANPLYQGRTIFFAIHPRYMNVDIRVIVDITKGSVDFYFSHKDDTFVVGVNPSTGVHNVSIDSKYGIKFTEPFMETYETYEIVYPNSRLRRRRRSIDTYKRISEFESPEISVNVTERTPQFKLREKIAEGLNTFVTITEQYDFVVVRNLRNRLVITLPQAVHDLRNTRFYIVLHSVGSEDSPGETFGTVFFRQDQPRIDLFVFFSVFFSCFFLFLAVCVVIWKVKQAVDLRRARQRHAVEMEHMASRPFAAMLVIIEEDHDDVNNYFPYSPSFINKKSKVIRYGHGRDSPKVVSDDKYGIRPVSVEATADGVASVSSVFFQLPGGDSAPVRLALGSALVLMKNYPSAYNSIKACMRRRVSHAS